MVQTESGILEKVWKSANKFDVAKKSRKNEDEVKKIGKKSGVLFRAAPSA